MSEHITRAYNDLVTTKWGTIVKTSDTKRIYDEAVYYEHIQRYPAKLHFPRLVSVDEGKYGLNLELEYFAYNNLAGRLFEYKDDYGWGKITDHLIECLGHLHQVEPDVVDADYGAFYGTKTMRYYQEYEDDIKKSNTLVINGKTYRNFNKLVEDGDFGDLVISLKNSANTSIVHGDCCLSNILYAENPITKVPSLKFIDPRGRFGNRQSIWGDPRYDYAKLSHSLNGGYEALISDRFNVSKVGENSYNLAVDNTKSRWIAKEYFDFNKDIRLIEGLIFVGMCSRHYDSVDRQRAMYLTGVKTLNEFL